MTQNADQFGTRDTLRVGGRDYVIYRLDRLAERTGADLSKLPFTIKVLLEALLRNLDGVFTLPEDVEAVAHWTPQAAGTREIDFKPARVLLQDFTGVPAVVDLAAMRDAMQQLGGDPGKINPLVPADLVIDHSVQVDVYGSEAALLMNAQFEFERNGERYEFLRWGQQAFDNFNVVPPATGIVHQVNLEFLATVVAAREIDGELVAFPDSLVGTDSHTTMINGLGVLGWGVGGIEAEAVLLGQPMAMLTPPVVGVRLSGKLRAGATATDLVLRVTELLRREGVVGHFVEFCGPGLSALSLADRATIANMAPEYGATCGFFPVDDETLRYLRLTGRDEEVVELAEAYCKAQGLFRTDDTPEPAFNKLLELDLATIEPSVAGPRRPQDRVPLDELKGSFWQSMKTVFNRDVKSDELPGRGYIRWAGESGNTVDAEVTPALNRASLYSADQVPVAVDGKHASLTHGSVVIAAITSCTNTSNPSVMLAAGLVAKKAVERGLTVSPHVKTSLAPGSRVVTEYYKKAGLLPFLEALGFNVVGYGCTTCISHGTPVLMADGTARRIEQLPLAGGALLFGPTAEGRLGLATQTERMNQGVRDCVALVLQDGRELICTPDHEILCEDGRWVRADELVPGRDRVVVGLEAPLDEALADEDGYVLRAGELIFTLESTRERLRTLAFARLLGHLLGDGSISALGQGRLHVGQAVDREQVLNDVELITGRRPAATRYDERKWTIVLPARLTEAIMALPGVRTGRRIDQAATLPAFVLDEACPTAVVREFLGGVFGADGTAPILKRLGEEAAILEQPAYSQSAKPEHVEQLREVMGQLTRLLARCGVDVEGARVYEYPVRRSASSYPVAQDGAPRVEVRLELPDGLSFVERVGFRYCADKALRASAAAVYWRTIDRINEQRLWMSERLTKIHQEQPALSFSRARALAASELTARETAVFPHYSLLEGLDRFGRLPQPEDRKFQPLHRESCGFPSPAALLEQIGARAWFAPLQAREETDYAKRYCVEKDALTLPTLSLQVIDRREVGERPVFDIAVDELHAFVAGGVSVHNCIGNSGPVADTIADAVKEHNLVVSAVLSGNRNFEGRINPVVRANYLASPPLVVAMAIAGTVDIDLNYEPLGVDKEGKPVYLADIWPGEQELQDVLATALSPDLFRSQYGNVFTGNPQWNAIPVAGGKRYEWSPSSTYIQNPPYFVDMTLDLPKQQTISDARVLALLGDSVTTDHISPAGSIPKDSPAGRYLIEQGVEPRDFNSYGARRGNHEVMMRGTFANIRLKNALAPGTEGGVTIYLPTGDLTSIYEAAMRYQAEQIPTIILAGREYGTGSSRDWAAKGPFLLGVRAVIAESFERIHRSNLIGMGVLPLEFLPGDGWEELGLSGQERYTIEGIDNMEPRQEITVRVVGENGSDFIIKTRSRIDSIGELEYYRHGGILHYVLRSLAKGQEPSLA